MSLPDDSMTYLREIADRAMRTKQFVARLRGDVLAGLLDELERLRARIAELEAALVVSEEEAT